MKSPESEQEESISAPLDDIRIIHPEADDVRDEWSSLEGVRDFEQEKRGNNLTFGDY
jgi:hypothetical protein